MTNREYLSTLTDEEMAHRMIASCQCCAFNEEDKCLIDGNLFCKDGLLEWFKQEHEVEGVG